MSTPTDRPMRSLFAVMVLALGLVLGATAAHAQDGGGSEPAPTEAPAQGAGSQTPPAVDDDGTDAQTPGDDGTVPAEDGGSEDDGDGNGDVLIVVLVAVLAVLVLAALGMVFGGRRSRPAAAPAPAARAAAPSPRRDVLANVRWLHDQLSIELLGAAGPQAAARWRSERARVDNMAIACQGVAADGGGDQWRQLASAVSALAGSLDTATELRAQTEPDPSLVTEAMAVVDRNRAQMLTVAEGLGRQA